MIQKHTTKTGQLSNTLYHMPISFVRGDVGKIGEKISGESERRRRDKRLIMLANDHQELLDRSKQEKTNVDFRTRFRSSRSLWKEQVISSKIKLLIEFQTSMEVVQHSPPYQAQTLVQLACIP